MLARIVFLLSICTSSMSALAVPVFINGSFEQGFSDWQTDFLVRPYLLSPDIQSFGFDGNKSIGAGVAQFEARGPSIFREYFRQTLFGFEIGETYTLSFYQQNNGSLASTYDDGRASWEVLLNGSTAFLSDAMAPFQDEWQKQMFEFVARQTSISFTFSPFDIDGSALLPGDTGVYPVLDGVQVQLGGIESNSTQVDGPATIALLGLGLLGLTARRRKS